MILGNAFGVPGITVDTHFQRLVQPVAAGPTETDPVKIEHAVGALIEKRDWTMLSHRVIFHGRRVCHARKPACGACTLAQLLPVVRHRPDRPGRGGQAAQGPPRPGPRGGRRASTRSWCRRRPSPRRCREPPARRRCSCRCCWRSPAAPRHRRRRRAAPAAARAERPSPFADCAAARPPRRPPAAAADGPRRRPRPASRCPTLTLPCFTGGAPVALRDAARARR